MEIGQDMRMNTTDLETRLSKLSPLQYAVTQQGQTERAFTGVYWDNHDDGTYRCVVCSAPLFDSTTKFESGTGWPSFFAEIENGRVATHEDTTLGMRRIEATCANCGAHLGHVFPDGPRPTGLRYCMNSASLAFDPRGEAAADATGQASTGA
jgi:peptide-methionine (R)-S-oxide reductase